MINIILTINSDGALEYSIQQNLNVIENNRNIYQILLYKRNIYSQVWQSFIDNSDNIIASKITSTGTLPSWSATYNEEEQMLSFDWDSGALLEQETVNSDDLINSSGLSNLTGVLDYIVEDNIPTEVFTPLTSNIQSKWLIFSNAPAIYSKDAVAIQLKWSSAIEGYSCLVPDYVLDNFTNVYLTLVFNKDYQRLITPVMSTPLSIIDNGIPTQPIDPLFDYSINTNNNQLIFGGYASGVDDDGHLNCVLSSRFQEAFNTEDSYMSFAPASSANQIYNGVYFIVQQNVSFGNLSLEKGDQVVCINTGWTVIKTNAPATVATESETGLMSATDKYKLNHLEAGAQANNLDAIDLIKGNNTITVPIVDKTAKINLGNQAVTSFNGQTGDVQYTAPLQTVNNIQPIEGNITLTANNIGALGRNEAANGVKGRLRIQTGAKTAVNYDGSQDVVIQITANGLNALTHDANIIEQGMYQKGSIQGDDIADGTIPVDKLSEEVITANGGYVAGQLTGDQIVVLDKLVLGSKLYGPNLPSGEGLEYGQVFFKT